MSGLQNPPPLSLLFLPPSLPPSLSPTFVHHHHRCLLQQSPGEAQQLSLPHREIGTPLIHSLLHGLHRSSLPPALPPREVDGGEGSVEGGVGVLVLQV